LATGPLAKAPQVPATARFILAPGGELEQVAPAAGPLLDATLRPGGARTSGTFAIRNQTGTTLGVSLRARPDSTALDGLLRVRLAFEGRTLASTTLQGLRAGSDTVRIPSGATRMLRLEAWLPRDPAGDSAGVPVDVSLVPATTPIGG
jgi:hypothetical protein